MNIKQLLDTLSPLDPASCKIHLATRSSKNEPLQVYCDGWFKQWQEDQNQRNFKRPRVLSLIHMPACGAWLFAGVYASRGCKPSTTREGKWVYSTEEIAEYADLNGRLIVDFARPSRMPYLRAEHWIDQIAVREILARKLSSPSMDCKASPLEGTGLDMFRPAPGSPALRKHVGSFQHTDGVGVDEAFHPVFNPPGSSDYTPRGRGRPVLVLFNNSVFQATYRHEGQAKAVHQESIRFKRPLKEEFRKVFPAADGAFTVALGQDFRHFVFTHEATVLDEDDEAGYSEGKEKYRLHRALERSAKVVRNAKAQFAAKHHGALFCEACGMDFATTYGERGDGFIEAHHRVPVAQMKKGHKTKVRDLAMLCSNCHRMIHRAPSLSVEGFAEALAVAKRSNNARTAPKHSAR